MNKIAHIFSWILSPMLMPTYAVFTALWITILAIYPVSVRWNVTLMIWLITCILPILSFLLLYKLKVISNPGLNNQHERSIPYIITMVCYLGASYYLYHIHAPQWLWMFMVGGAIAAIVSFIVNIWWKISGHGAGIGGYIALLFRIAVDGLSLYDIWPFISVAILLAGILGTSRIILKCHTLGQVLAGIANGFLWVFILS